MIYKLFTDDDFDADISCRDGYSLIDFSAKQCGPCRKMDPVLEETDIKLGDRIKFFSADRDALNKTAKQCEIMGVPTFILFKDGEEIDRCTGYFPISKFIKWLEGSL